MAGRRWTESEDSLVIWYWLYSDETILKHLPGRTLCAIEWRGANVLDLVVADRRRGWTTADIAKHLGYDRGTIARMARRLGLRRMRNLRWSDRAVEAMMAELSRSDFPIAPNQPLVAGWGGSKPPACLMCGTTSKRHARRGLCTMCSQRMIRTGGPLPPKVRPGVPYPLTCWPPDDERLEVAA